MKSSQQGSTACLSNPEACPLLHSPASAISFFMQQRQAPSLCCCPCTSISCCSRHPEILDAVAALARHVCLKAPDKADCRAAAVKAASELLADLPQWEQEQFTGFVYNLSRTPKVCGRSWPSSKSLEGFQEQHIHLGVVATLQRTFVVLRSSDAHRDTGQACLHPDAAAAAVRCCSLGCERCQLAWPTTC